MPKQSRTKAPILQLQLLASGSYPIALFRNKQQLATDTRKASILCHLMFSGGLTVDRLHRIFNSLSKPTIQSLLTEMLEDEWVETYETQIAHSSFIYYRLPKPQVEQTVSDRSAAKSMLGQVRVTIDPSLATWKPAPAIDCRKRDELKRQSIKEDAEKERRLAAEREKTKKQVERQESKQKAETQKRSKAKNAAAKPLVKSNARDRMIAAFESLKLEDRLLLPKEICKKAGVYEKLITKPGYRDIYDEVMRWNGRFASDISPFKLPGLVRKAKEEAERRKVKASSKPNLMLSSHLQRVFDAIAEGEINQIQLSKKLNITSVEAQTWAGQLWSRGLIVIDLRQAVPVYSAKTFTNHQQKENAA